MIINNERYSQDISAGDDIKRKDCKFVIKIINSENPSNFLPLYLLAISSFDVWVLSSVLISTSLMTSSVTSSMHLDVFKTTELQI